MYKTPPVPFFSCCLVSLRLIFFRSFVLLIIIILHYHPPLPRSLLSQSLAPCTPQRHPFYCGFPCHSIHHPSSIIHPPLLVTPAIIHHPPYHCLLSTLSLLSASCFGIRALMSFSSFPASPYFDVPYCFISLRSHFLSPLSCNHCCSHSFLQVRTESAVKRQQKEKALSPFATTRKREM